MSNKLAIGLGALILALVAATILSLRGFQLEESTMYAAAVSVGFLGAVLFVRATALNSPQPNDSREPPLSRALRPNAVVVLPLLILIGLVLGFVGDLAKDTVGKQIGWPDAFVLAVAITALAATIVATVVSVLRSVRDE